jgi:mono/diheme cytochrome c family protein
MKLVAIPGIFKLGLTVITAISLMSVIVLISPRQARAQDQSAVTDQDVGKAIYEVRCEACHGPDGKSWRNQATQVPAPPLKGDEFVIAAPDTVIADVIRNGRTGEKRHYDDTYADMPSFDASMIADLRPLLAYLKGDMQSSNSK